jgi:hypothetical protein
MTNYWSCTKFADWIRGTAKLSHGTIEQWDDWNNKAQSYNPIRFWLAEQGLDRLQKIIFFIPEKLYAIKYYINNRWITRTHCLSAHSRDIKPGTWRDVGDRFLPCLFNELVDFVEIELAWWQIAWAEKTDREKYKPPFWASGWFRWRTWRCKRAGLDNLAWQMNLKHDEDYCKDEKYYMQPTPQAIRAKEIYELYFWWTVTRPVRPDANDASGWTAVCEEQREANGGKFSFNRPEDPAFKKKYNKAFKLLNKIEKSYETEDEEMMIRLIKIRDSLWT